MVVPPKSRPPKIETRAAKPRTQLRVSVGLTPPTAGARPLPAWGYSELAGWGTARSWRCMGTFLAWWAPRLAELGGVGGLDDSVVRL